MNRAQRFEAMRLRHQQRAKKQSPAEAARLRAALAAIKKRHGEDAIDPFMGTRTAVSLPCVSTGNQTIDDFLTGSVDPETRETIAGSGRGLPTGRVIEVFGKESSGKTTLTLFFIAAFQARGGVCAFIDVEHAFDPEYARRLGVNMETLLFSQPSSAEEALDIVQELVSRNVVDLVVVDSVAALTGKDELEGASGDVTVGLQARLMGQALRKLTTQLGTKSQADVIFVNQIREKIVRFGNPETTPGGNALRFYSSIRLDVRRVAGIKHKQEDVGIRSRIKAVKNKVAQPFRQVFVDIENGDGITKVYTKFKRAR